MDKVLTQLGNFCILVNNKVILSDKYSAILSWSKGQCCTKVCSEYWCDQGKICRNIFSYLINIVIREIF